MIICKTYSFVLLSLMYFTKIYSTFNVSIFVNILTHANTWLEFVGTGKIE